MEAPDAAAAVVVAVGELVVARREVQVAAEAVLGILVAGAGDD